ncbi:uncharacterized protein LOC106666093 [Cimex lectularius]|uniref:Uncharacterized protein n=1 Tax=Cimex lectularius TaxID=79782 RepID=A0A8I6RP16_CIMLE|nr:uncharacterized protein LOC106666093 [Cimex lectularius]
MALPGLGRKRYRNSCDDEVSEFAPLSKRINNLHINNGTINNLGKNLESKTEAHRDIIVNNERLSTQDYEDSRNMDGESSGSQQLWLPHYSPDLSPSQNPYYYESNRLLFELYIQRSQRSNGASSSNQHQHHY